MARLGIVCDGACERLVAVSRSVALGGWLPKESSKALLDSANGVRSALIGRAPRLAARHLDTISELVGGVDDGAVVEALTSVLTEAHRAIEHEYPNRK